MPDLRLLSADHDLVVRSQDEQGLRVVSVSGEADLQTEHRLSRALRDVVPGPGGGLVLDLTGLTFCSAYAMGVLVDMVGSTAHRGFDVSVVGLPAITARVWLLTDVPIPTQYATVEQAVSSMSSRLKRLENHTDSEHSTARLLAELDGLRRALATRAIIEQAKGMLMERLTCTSEEAFNLIVLQAQRSGRKLHDIAAGYLRSTPETPAIQTSLPLASFPVRGGTVPEPPDPESAA